jgi:MYXO-CTERM domain-containing protein
MRSSWMTLAGLVAGGLLASEARAVDTTVDPGTTTTLSADLVLTGSDNFTAGAAAGARCTIHGAGHAIASAEGWTGNFALRNCDVDGLGTADVAAIYLKAAGAAGIAIEGSQFSASGLLRFDIDGAVQIGFRDNTIAADGLYPAVSDYTQSAPAFWVTGDSTGSKVFERNDVYKSRIKLSATSNWRVEGNVLVGIRAGIELESASNITVRGNYSHTEVGGPMWNQVKNILVQGGDGMVIEHNVFWGRQWLADISGGGQFQYNLLIDSVERGWVLIYYNAPIAIHHNLLIQTKKSENEQASGIVVVGDANETLRAEVYNNTFDAGGKCNPGIPAAVEFIGSAVLKSLRSNAFLNIRVVPEPGAALVRLTSLDYPDDQKLPDYMPVHLGYADYNLFFNPDSPVKVNYGVSVAGKVARQDPGFGANDVPARGKLDEQVDPGLAFANIPRLLPYSEDDIRSGAATVCQILAFYRQRYTPNAGSPLYGKGDPADGIGNDIGAIGDGDPGDKFGTLCDPADVGSPTPDLAVCPEVPLIIVNPTGGGGSGPPPGSGIVCVCAAGEGGPSGSGLATAALVLAMALARRRRHATR